MRGIDELSALVEECPFPSGVVDLTSLYYVAANDGAAEMFGLDSRPVGEHVLQFGQDPDLLAMKLRMLRGTGIHWFETAWELRTADGAPFVREGWAVSLAGHPDLVFVVAGPSECDRAVVDVRHRSSTSLTVAVVDDEWRILSVSRDILALLGWREDQWRGRPLLGELHPADVARFCEGAFRARHSGGGIRIEARLREFSGSWRLVTVAIIPEPSTGELPRMVVTLSPHVEAVASARDAALNRWATLSGGLEDARAAVRHMLLDRMPSVDLSARQLEIVSRLLRGERVRTVATELHLSQSTVRNHLSAAFKKIGVSSQEELFGRLRSGLDDPSR